MGWKCTLQLALAGAAQRGWVSWEACRQAGRVVQGDMYHVTGEG